MNNELTPVLQSAAATLRAAETRFALVGGLAVGIRTEPRFTRDIDFAVAVADDVAAERIARYLLTSGYPTASMMTNQRTGRLATLRFLPPLPAGVEPEDRPYVDLLFTTSGIEREVVEDAEAYIVERGFVLPVATIPPLMAMKLRAASDRRKQDYLDLDHLVTRATDAELRRVRVLLRLMLERDPGIEVDLHARFDALLAEHGRSG